MDDFLSIFFPVLAAVWLANALVQIGVWKGTSPKDIRDHIHQIEGELAEVRRELGNLNDTMSRISTDVMLARGRRGYVRPGEYVDGDDE